MHQGCTYPLLGPCRAELCATRLHEPLAEVEFRRSAIALTTKLTSSRAHFGYATTRALVNNAGIFLEELSRPESFYDFGGATKSITCRSFRR